jgi:hypothetical protein
MLGAGQVAIRPSSRWYWSASARWLRAPKFFTAAEQIRFPGPKLTPTVKTASDFPDRLLLGAPMQCTDNSVTVANPHRRAG